MCKLILTVKMSTFCSRLDLDKDNLTGKLVLIVEENKGNANFAVNSLLWQAVQEKQSGILLIAIHYPLHHYALVSNKLGFRLLPLVQSERLIGIDAKQYVFDNLLTGRNSIFVNGPGGACDLKALFGLIVEKLALLSQKYDKVYLLIDDVSDLMNMGANVNSVNIFVHYLRTLINPQRCLILCTHCNDSDEDQLLLKNRLLHVADIGLTIACLKTGISSDITGTIEIVKKDTTTLSQFSVKNLHHYKLTDRSIRIFAPGSLI